MRTITITLMRGDEVLHIEMPDIDGMFDRVIDYGRDRGFHQFTIAVDGGAR